MKESVKILAAAVLMAIAYGVLHDLVTAQVSVEYFTIGHPTVIKNETPVRLALVWGVLATWWMGLAVGVIVLLASRAGKYRKYTLEKVIRPLITLIAIMALTAPLSGIVGYYLARSGSIWLVTPLADQVPATRHAAFLAAGWAHGASYIVGSVGALVVGVVIYRKRKKG